MQLPTERTVRLARLEGETAVLVGADGVEIRWRAADLPAELLRGGDVRVRFQSPAAEAAERSALAAAVLNGLLTPSAAGDAR